MVQNLPDLIKKFSDEQVCRNFLVQQRWGGSPECPYCGSSKWYSIENGKRFKCGNKECYKKYSVTVGTIFHASNIPLTTWFPAMYLIMSHKKGISSIQLAKDLGVTQKTGWFMLMRIRQSLKDKDSSLLKGTIEVDETYLGKKYRSDFVGLSEDEVTEQMKNAQKNKGAVMGMAQRDGKIVVKALDGIDSKTAQAEIKQRVEVGSKVYTDSSGLYRSGLEDFERGSVRHNARPHEWVRGDIHVNTMESFWGMLKRGVYGIYHQISYKHLQRYCDEFAYRRNSKSLKDGDRFCLSLAHIDGKLPYKQLVHGKSIEAKEGI